MVSSGLAFGGRRAPAWLAIVGLCLLWACAGSAYNAGDPASRDFVIFSILECLLRPRCIKGMGEISASRDGHNLRLFPDATFRSWGPNSNGRLGRNNETTVGNGIGPSVIVAGDVALGYEVDHVAAGHQFSCAIHSFTRLRCWGFNNNGQLGDNSTQATSKGGGTPDLQNIGDVPVGGEVRQVAPSALHNCALLADGSVRCWGNGSDGRLGYGDTNNVGSGGVAATIIAKGNVPVGGTVVQIATGSNHTCALLNTGGLRCWGLGTNGMLGYGDLSSVGTGTGPHPTIEGVGDVPVGGDVAQVSCGTDHTCALLRNGNIRCWGLGTNGRLGYGNPNTVGDAGTSIMVAGDVPLGGTAVYVSAGPTHTCALMSTGAVRCWGLGTLGRLGYNNTQNVGDGTGSAATPAAAGDVNVGGTGVALTTGAGHTCVILSTGGVRCWGDGAEGRLGHNNTSIIGDGAGLSIIQAGDVPLR